MACAVANPGRAHGDRPLLSRLRRRTDAGHDLALGQVAVAHHPVPTVLGQQNVTVGYRVSLLRWRSGGSNTPTIRRLTPSCRHQLSRIALLNVYHLSVLTTTVDRLLRSPRTVIAFFRGTEYLGLVGSAYRIE